MLPAPTPGGRCFGGVAGFHVLLRSALLQQARRLLAIQSGHLVTRRSNFQGVRNLNFFSLASSTAAQTSWHPSAPNEVQPFVLQSARLRTPPESGLAALAVTKERPGSCRSRAPGCCKEKERGCLGTKGWLGGWEAPPASARHALWAALGGGRHDGGKETHTGSHNAATSTQQWCTATQTNASPTAKDKGPGLRRGGEAEGLGPFCSLGLEREQ